MRVSKIIGVFPMFNTGVSVYMRLTMRKIRSWHP